MHFGKITLVALWEMDWKGRRGSPANQEAVGISPGKSCWRLDGGWGAEGTMDGFQRELDVYQSGFACVFDAAGEGLRESRVIAGLPSAAGAGGALF